jgi:beta-glucanase (GH16 family)
MDSFINTSLPTSNSLTMIQKGLISGVVLAGVAAVAALIFAIISYTKHSRIKNSNPPQSQPNHHQIPCDEGSRDSNCKYMVTFSDDFNKSEVDTDKWTMEVNNDQFITFSCSDYTDSIDNVFIKNQQLHIKLTAPGLKNCSSTNNNKCIKSGRVRTKNKLGPYGVLEVKALVPKETSLWPAIWLNGEGTAWPSQGEIDIMETYGALSGRTIQPAWLSTLHCGSALGDDNQYPADGKNKLGDIDWSIAHVYTLQWTSTALSLYLDATFDPKTDTFDKGPTRVYTISDVDCNGGPKFTNPLNLIMNIAAGGGKIFPTDQYPTTTNCGGRSYPDGKPADGTCYGTPACQYALANGAEGKEMVIDHVTFWQDVKDITAA